MNMVKTSEIIKLAGGIPQLMILLDLRSTQAIYAWNGTVPLGRVYELRVKRPEWFDVHGRVVVKRVGQ